MIPGEFDTGAVEAIKQILKDKVPVVRAESGEFESLNTGSLDSRQGYTDELNNRAFSTWY
jgi:hypothetical protein